MSLARPDIATTVRNYISLTKPRIISLLLITTVPAMVVAEKGWPSTWLVLATVIGGSLSAAGANAINCWYDRDIDAVMRRTQRRPLATGEIQPLHGLVFGITLGVVAFGFLWATTTLAAALLALAALLFYVLIYTVWLKRRTPQNIVIGGAAGAAPPVLGWTAVTGSVHPHALLLFLIIYAWTPPHFWALAIARRNDYARVDIPMLPVTHGVEFTRLHVLLYTVILALVTTLPFITGMSGLIYLGAAIVLNARFLLHALVLKLTRRDELPMRVFRFSISYLMWLFLALLVDHYLPTTQGAAVLG